MSYYEIRYLNRDEDQVSEFADFEDEAQELIDELIEDGRTVLTVILCENVTKQFRIEAEE